MQVSNKSSNYHKQGPTQQLFKAWRAALKTNLFVSKFWWDTKCLIDIFNYSHKIAEEHNFKSSSVLFSLI